MPIEAARSRFEQLLARHPEIPFELELLLLQLATACTRLERATADLMQSVAADEDLGAGLNEAGIERRWTEAGELELWQDGRLMASARRLTVSGR
jgi:hypothetical protein